jgi:hypothetical protein
MRGSKVKALRTEDRPHPGRLGGGKVKDVGRKGERLKWMSSKDRRRMEEKMMEQWRQAIKERITKSKEAKEVNDGGQD